MLSALRFEPAPPPAPRIPDRADVACFVGTVRRRAGQRLPDAVRMQLEADGWIRGPGWPTPERAEEILDLYQVPVACDSWETFDRLFDWAARPVEEGSPATGATWLGAAVRSFFIHGGRTAVVVRVGDPWPFLDATAGDEARRQAAADRLRALIPWWASGDLALPDPPFRPFSAVDPFAWLGVEHLYGLTDVSHLCLPDLSEILAAEPIPLRVVDPPPPPPEGFVPCSTEPPSLPGDRGLRRVSAPRLDADGYRVWSQALERITTFLGDHRRDALLVTSFPLPLGDDTGSVAALRDGEPDPGNPYVQMVWPWAVTTHGTDLPEGLEPPEGLFAGVLARNALERGTYRSVAGTRLPSVVREFPPLDRDLGEDSATARLARRVCLIGPESDGTTVLSDVTTSAQEAWRQGGVRRMVASLLRRARRVGAGETFASNGPELWARLRRSMEAVLEDHYRAGALRGSSPEEAYTVRCGPETTTRNDLDGGRVRVEVSVLPAVSIERIRVVVELAPGGADLRSVEVA